MAAVDEVEALIARLSRAEKAQLLVAIVRDLGDAFPGIVSTPGINGGEPCVVPTRIPVWTLVRARELGLSEVGILRAYPTLMAEDLVMPGSMHAHIGPRSRRKLPRTRRRREWRGFTCRYFGTE